MSTDPNKLSFTIDEAARAIGVSRSKVYELVRLGELTTFKWCGRTLIRADVLEDYQRPLPADCDGDQEADQQPRAGVYLLFSGARIAYVGRSTNVRSRLSEHRRSGRAFDEARVILCDAATAAWLEPELIRTLGPEQNLLRYTRRAAAAELATAEVSAP